VQDQPPSLATAIEWEIELVILPVSDVDRANALDVDQVGFLLDHDQRRNPELRFVELTPRGFACSIAFGRHQCRSHRPSVKGEDD
jgi:hypothetical protein